MLILSSRIPYELAESLIVSDKKDPDDAQHRTMPVITIGLGQIKTKLTLAVVNPAPNKLNRSIFVPAIYNRFSGTPGPVVVIGDMNMFPNDNLTTDQENSFNSFRYKELTNEAKLTTSSEMEPNDTDLQTSFIATDLQTSFIAAAHDVVPGFIRLLEDERYPQIKKLVGTTITGKSNDNENLIRDQLKTLERDDIIKIHINLCHLEDISYPVTIGRLDRIYFRGDVLLDDDVQYRFDFNPNHIPQSLTLADIREASAAAAESRAYFTLSDHPIVLSTIDVPGLQLEEQASNFSTDARATNSTHQASTSANADTHYHHETSILLTPPSSPTRQ